MTAPTIGRLPLVAATGHLGLLAAPVATALEAAGLVADAWVSVIDPALADTAALTEAYDLPAEASANCVVLLGRRGGEARSAACVVQAHTRADVNGLARRTLDVRKISFAPHEQTVAETGMEHGGITPVGLPSTWPVLVDARVVEEPWLVLGSGVRRSKLVLPGAALTALPSVQVLEGLGVPVEP